MAITDTYQNSIHKLQDEEANLFALLVLMPSKQFIEDMKQEFDLHDDSQFKALCKKYKCSMTMLTYRIVIYSKQRI